MDRFTTVLNRTKAGSAPPPIVVTPGENGTPISSAIFDYFAGLIMVDKEKMENEIYALHGIILKARSMAYETGSSNRLAELLDAAEMLPRVIASSVDESEKFRDHINEISSTYECEFVAQRFHNPVPADW